MSHDEPRKYLGTDLDLVLTDDEVRTLRSAARLTLNEAGIFFELDGALRAIIILTDEVDRLRTELERLRTELEQQQGVTDEEDGER